MRKQQEIDTQTKPNWQVFQQIWPYLSDFKTVIAIAIVCLIFAKLATIAMPFILKLIIDKLVGEPSTFDQNTQLLLSIATPISLVLMYGLLRFSSVVFGELRDTLFSRITDRAVRRVGLQVFRHLHQLDIDFHLNRRTGGLARDIDRGASGISFIMRFMVFNIIPTLIEITLVVVILFSSFGVKFALVTASAIIIYIAFSVITTNWRNQFVREANEADAETSTRAIDSLLNYETVKTFTNEDYESRRYDKDLANWETAKRKNRLSLLALNIGQALIISAAITILLVFAANDALTGLMTVGDFAMVNAFMLQLFLPLNFLGFVYREIRVALVNIERMLEVLATPPIITDQPGASPLDSIDSAIIFNSVSFHYDQSRPILNQITFRIEPRQTVAIVGPSGSGKSTIVKLIQRFYDPTQGYIAIGNQKLAQIQIHSLRSNIGVVPQDTVLFNDTILENIRYGRPDASEDEVWLAAEMAHLTQFIRKLPEGINTQVGERGLKLSGGEKQRVAIARALLKRPPLMIFDEATSSLDTRSESAILEAIEEIASNYTSLVIAHRLSTIVNADRIIVLKNGEIQESGTHKQLLQTKGLYADMWHAQQKQRTKKFHSD